MLTYVASTEKTGFVKFIFCMRFDFRCTQSLFECSLTMQLVDNSNRRTREFINLFTKFAIKAQGTILIKTRNEHKNLRVQELVRKVSSLLLVITSEILFSFHQCSNL